MLRSPFGSAPREGQLSLLSATTMATRPYRGSRVSSFYPVKSIPPLSALDSAFQLQEYISLLIRLDVHDVDAIVSLPGKPAPKDQDETPDPPEQDAKKPDDPDRKTDVSVDRACWIYEQLRSAQVVHSHTCTFRINRALQPSCPRPFAPPDYDAPTRVHAELLSSNEGGRVALSLCCSR